MAAPETAALQAAYVQTQKTLGERAALLVLGYWASTLGAADDKSDLRALADRWLSLSIPVIIQARRLSAQYGQAFYKAQRRIEIPNELSFRTPSVAEVDRAKIATSLWVTGPLKYVDQGQPLDDIQAEERLNAITGAVTRQAQSGGREAIDAAYKADPKAVGYYRVEDGDPCYFCSALMSRGVVYKEDSFEESDPRFFGPGSAKVHDHCGGSLVAAYDKDPFPGATKQYGELWKKFKYENEGTDDLEAWRKFYETNKAAQSA